MLDIGHDISIGLARRDEVAEIRAMQAFSLQVLGAPYYTPREIDGFIAHFGTMDEAVVDEGHYFIGRTADGSLVVSGGWSQREPGYERGHLYGPADIATAATGTVRSVFIHPGMARMGLGSRLMRTVEQDAAGNGIEKLRLMATLSGRPFYTRLGWREEGAKTIALPGGGQFRCVAMSRQLSAGTGSPFGAAVENA